MIKKLSNNHDHDHEWVYTNYNHHPMIKTNNNDNIYIYTNKQLFGENCIQGYCKATRLICFWEISCIYMITYHLRRGKNIRLYQQVWSTMVNMIRLFGSISWHINVGIIIGINCMRINMQGKCSMSSFFPTGEDRGQSYGLFPVTGKEY